MIAFEQRRSRRTTLTAAALAALAFIPKQARAEDEEAAKPWFPTIQPAAPPDDVYDKHALSVVRIGDQGWRVSRGKQLEGVTTHDFFVTVGRHDLASIERDDKRTRLVLICSGTILFLTGGMLAVTHKSSEDPPLTWGLAFMGVGLGVAIAGARTGGPSLSRDEAESMVTRYNRQLRSHIELETDARKAPIQSRLRGISPFLDGRSGFGLAVLATF